MKSNGKPTPRGGISKLANRTLALALALAFAAPVVLGEAYSKEVDAPNEDCGGDQVEGGGDGQSMELVPYTLPEELSATLDFVDEQQYWLMSSLFDPGTNDLMDSLLEEPDLFPVGDLLYDSGVNYNSDAIGIGKEVANDGVSSEILKSVIEVAQGTTPTLRTLIYLREVSQSRDRWDFSITVKALGACGVNLGASSEFLSVTDNRAKDDSGMKALDFPLKKATANVDEIETLEVKLRVYHCKSGWWTGKHIECKEGPTAGSIDVEIV